MRSGKVLCFQILFLLMRSIVRLPRSKLPCLKPCKKNKSPLATKHWHCPAISCTCNSKSSRTRGNVSIARSSTRSLHAKIWWVTPIVKRKSRLLIAWRVPVRSQRHPHHGFKKIQEAQAAVGKVFADDRIKGYTVDIVNATRDPAAFGCPQLSLIEMARLFALR